MTEILKRESEQWTCARFIVQALAANGCLAQTENGSDHYEHEAERIIEAHIRDLYKLNEYLLRKLTETHAELMTANLSRIVPAGSPHNS